MKFRNLFNLAGDAKDVIDFFDGVENMEQMISRLERMKKRDAEEFLACIQSLEVSVNAAMDDTLEMGTDTSMEDEDLEIGDDELEGLEETEEEKTEEDPSPAPSKG